MKLPKSLTREQVRQIDRVAIEQYGLPGVVLMENAGRGTARLVIDLLGEVEGKRVVIACGGGNNGGDGLVIGRHLHNAGADVLVLLAVDPDELKGDAQTNYRIAKAMNLPMRHCRSNEQVAQAGELLSRAAVIVDALLGTGFAGRVRPPLAALIERINAAHALRVKVVAVDVPSGLDCDTGAPGGVAVQADLTATFVAPKVGMQAPDAWKYVGQIAVVDIGVPRELVPRDE